MCVCVCLLRVGNVPQNVVLLFSQTCTNVNIFLAFLIEIQLIYCLSFFDANLVKFKDLFILFFKRCQS